MKRLLIIAVIIVFLSPCICVAEEFEELSMMERARLWHSSPTKCMEYDRKKREHDGCTIMRTALIAVSIYNHFPISPLELYNQVRHQMWHFQWLQR